MRHFTFFGGKGGTGKTSCAASYALSLAARGVRTLVVSTDPAHSLADAFDKPIGFQTAPLCPNLWGLEIDAEVEAKKYMISIQDKMLDLVSAAIVDEIKRQIEIAYMSPGAKRRPFSTSSSSSWKRWAGIMTPLSSIPPPPAILSGF
jgi:arsenite-transporting ATPase